MQARVAALAVGGSKIAFANGWGGRFTDDDFPAANDSLTGKQDGTKSLEHNDAAKWSELKNEIVWNRPPPSVHVFGTDSVGRAGVIQQGGLGDCWFLAAAGALADRPKVLKSIIPETEGWKNGRYEVHATKNGLPTKVIVDDLFPCYPSKYGSFKPVFARLSAEEELWPLILEKAWAKLHGSYARIEGGYSFNAMRDLTGAPGEKVIPRYPPPPPSLSLSPSPMFHASPLHPHRHTP